MFGVKNLGNSSHIHIRTKHLLIYYPKGVSTIFGLPVTATDRRGWAGVQKVQNINNNIKWLLKICVKVFGPNCRILWLGEWGRGSGGTNNPLKSSETTSAHTSFRPITIHRNLFSLINSSGCGAGKSKLTTANVCVREQLVGFNRSQKLTM